MSLVDNARRARRIFLRERFWGYVSKHEGPGNHSTGTPQEAHAGGGAKGTIEAPPIGIDGLPDSVQKAILDTVAKREREEGFDLSPDTLTRRLRGLWDEFYNEDRDGHKEAMGWYDGANRTARLMSDAYGIDEERSSGIIAALSPQTGWGRNKEMAVNLGMLLREDPVILSPTGDRRRLSELDSDDAAFWAIGLMHPTARVNEGRRKGEPAFLFEQSGENVAKAIDLFRGGSPDDVLGGEKVRSFYNNVLLPDERTSWTDDTHMRRIWLDDPKREISNEDDNFRRIFGTAPTRSSAGYGQGYGLYPYFAQQGADVGDQIGVLPHQVQSTTWTWWRKKTGADKYDSETSRGLLTPEQIREMIQDDDPVTPF